MNERNERNGSKEEISSKKRNIYHFHFLWNLMYNFSLLFEFYLFIVKVQILDKSSGEVNFPY
jgi:hypothetical protein